MSEITSGVQETTARIVREIDYNAGEAVSEIPRIWIIATIFGGIWGTLEITLGAFIHNLRIPFGGMLLTTIAAFFLTLVAMLYPIKGLLVRMGLIASLCKSLSPGGLIITPMIAIFMEGLLAEIVYRTVGVNIIGAVLAGTLLPLWSFFQKIFGSIIFYGTGLVDIYLQILKASAGFLHAPPAILVAVMLLFLAMFGICGSAGALFFFRHNREALLDFHGHCKIPSNVPAAPEICLPDAERKRVFTASFLSLLILCFAFQFTGQILLSLFLLMALVTLVYATQKQVFFKFVKPKFWMSAFVIVALSGLFLGKRVPQGGVFSIHGFFEGCKMLLRAATLYLFVLSFSRLFAIKDIHRIFRKFGQEQMVPILKRAFDLLPEFLSLYKQQLDIHRKSGRRFSHFLCSVFSSAIAMVNEKGLKILVITGDIETGKTTSAMEIARSLDESGMPYRAVIQPRILAPLQGTIGYKMVLLPGRCESELAVRNESGFGYRFYPKAFRTAARFIRALPRPDIFIVDEFGKLELRGDGHFRYCFSGMHTWGGLWILTMREEYLLEFEKKLRTKFTRVLSIL